MYKEKTAKGFGDIAITNKGNSEFLIKVKELIEWEKLNKILQRLEMSIKNCTIFPIYLCTVFSVYFFNLDSADAVLYEFPKILTILE